MAAAVAVDNVVVAVLRFKFAVLVAAERAVTVDPIEVMLAWNEVDKLAETVDVDEANDATLADRATTSAIETRRKRLIRS